MSKTPTILKKDDSQRPPRVQTHQPKILTKSCKENTTATTQVHHQQESTPCPQMRTYKRLLQPPFQLNTKVLDYLDSDNTDFLVVCVVGPKNVGKTTLMNIIANPNYLSISEDTCSVSLQADHPFPTEVVYEGTTIDMFITTDRIIFLDTSPLLTNVQRRDMIVSECSDIEMLLMLLQVCHLVLVVNDGFPDIPVIRLLTLAEHMIPDTIKHRPVYVYIGNRLQPGTKMLTMDARIHNGANVIVPNLHHPDINLHHDIHQIIQDLQEKVYMMKRCSMENDEEIFTEKKWGQRFVGIVEQVKNDYFLRKYEAFRDKFHQPIESS